MKRTNKAIENRINRVLDILRENPIATNEQLSVDLEVSMVTVSGYLKFLRAGGFISTKLQRVKQDNGNGTYKNERLVTSITDERIEYTRVKRKPKTVVFQTVPTVAEVLLMNADDKILEDEVLDNFNF